MDAAGFGYPRDHIGADVLMRKTKTVTVNIKGRDEGKQFLLTEMPASRIEKWAARALLAVAHSGVEVPEEVTGAGMAALAVVGLRALSGVSFAEAEPLLDEMMGCVQIIPDPAHPAIVRRLSPDESDIEEVMTYAFLRGEVFELHTGFSIADAIQKPASASVRPASSVTRTSRKRSAR